MGNRSLDEFIFPPTQSLDQAKRAARQGVWASLFLAAFSGFFYFAAMAEYKRFELNPHAIAEIVVFLLVAWQVNRMSRAAAVLGLIALILERTYSYLQYGMDIKLGSVILVIFFMNAIRGTFAYYRTMNQPTATVHAG